MPDGTTSGLMHLWDWAGKLWIFLLGLLVWNGKRMVSRVDEIEANYVHSDAFEKAVERVRGDMKEYHRDTKADINGINERIDRLK